MLYSAYTAPLLVKGRIQQLTSFFIDESINLRPVLCGYSLTARISERHSDGVVSITTNRSN